MALDGIDLVRGPGRPTSVIEVDYVRDIRPSDIALANNPAIPAAQPLVPHSLVKIKERHHALARCVASGFSAAHCSAVTGYSPTYISILLADPSFKELVSDYRAMEDAAFVDFQTRAGTLAATAIGNLQDLLEGASDPSDGNVSPQLTLEIAKVFADRTGNAPVTRSVQLTGNVELGNRLAEARRRISEPVSLPAAELVTVIEGDSESGEQP